MSPLELSVNMSYKHAPLYILTLAAGLISQRVLAADPSILPLGDLPPRSLRLEPRREGGGFFECIHGELPESDRRWVSIILTMGPFPNLCTENVVQDISKDCERRDPDNAILDGLKVIEARGTCYVKFEGRKAECIATGLACAAYAGYSKVECVCGSRNRLCDLASCSNPDCHRCPIPRDRSLSGLELLRHDRSDGHDRFGTLVDAESRTTLDRIWHKASPQGVMPMDGQIETKWWISMLHSSAAISSKGSLRIKFWARFRSSHPCSLVRCTIIRLPFQTVMMELGAS